MDKIIPILENTDFEYKNVNPKSNTHLVVKSKSPDIRTHHIHFMEIDGEKWREYLSFRNRLINNEGLALEYSKLKIELAKKYANDRNRYTLLKGEFIRRVLGK